MNISAEVILSLALTAWLAFTLIMYLVYFIKVKESSVSGIGCLKLWLRFKRANRKDFKEHKCIHLWYDYETMKPIVESNEYHDVEHRVKKGKHPLDYSSPGLLDSYSLDYYHTHAYCPKCKQAGKKFKWKELYQYALLLEEKGYPVTPDMLDKQIEIQNTLKRKYKKLGLPYI